MGNGRRNSSRAETLLHRDRWSVFPTCMHKSDMEPQRCRSAFGSAKNSQIPPVFTAVQFNEVLALVGFPAEPASLLRLRFLDRWRLGFFFFRSRRSFGF